MKKLTNYERETVILFNEAEKIATIETFSVRLIKRLNQLVETRPEECKLTGVSDYGSVSYECPKLWLKIIPKRILTDQEKVSVRNRLGRIS